MKDHFAVYYTTLDTFEQPATHGKWMVFKHFDEIDETWEKIRTAMAEGELEGCEWVKCSTAKYDPTKEGPGPSTCAVICVHTNELDIDAIGFSLVWIVNQDIKYKTNEVSQNREFAFTVERRVAQKTIFWNYGSPSTEYEGEICSGTSFYKDDIWHLNVVTAPEPFHSVEVHGRWILMLEYVELTALWHHLKKIIESKDNFGIITMVCPPKLDRRSKDEVPVFHIYTGTKQHRFVGEQLLKIIQRDIYYEPRPEFQGVVETLHWNRVFEYLKAYQHIISTQAIIELPFLKIVFLGAPRLGKTTMRRRLTREIDDIDSAGEAEQPSTGILESEHNVIIRNLSSTTAIVTSSEWSSTKDISEEVRMLFQFIFQTYNDMSPMEESQITADNVYIHHEPQASPQSTDQQGSVVDFKPLPATGAAPSEASLSKKDSIMSDEEIQEFFSKALSTDNWEEEIKYLLKDTALLSMSDVGGQPEFMDMQPAFVLGPALYLVFCNLSRALQDHYSVSYLHSSDGSTKPDKSFYTVEEVIFQALSAITCLGKVATSVDPETSTPLPTTSAASPTTSAALPMTSATLPPTCAALPTTSAALPTTSAALPTTSAALPTTSAALPTTSAALPTTSAALPTTSAARPTTSAARPMTSAALPTTSAALPTTSAARPTTSAARPTTSAALPTTSAALPTTSAALPTTSAALPTTSAALPTTSAALPTTSAARPTTSAARPTTSAARPTTSAALPTTSAALPTTSAARPTTSAARPTTSAARPTTSATLPITSAALLTTNATPPTYSTGQPPSMGLEATVSSPHLTQKL